MSTRSGAIRASRRAVLRAAGTMALAGGAVALSGHGALARDQAAPDVAVFPRHGTRTASPETEISFRGLLQEHLGTLRIVGSLSGGHSGLLLPHSDGNGLSFVPDARFEPGETVTVSAAIPLVPSEDGTLSFEVVRPARMTRSPDARVTDDPAVEPHVFRSRPDLRPPVMRVTEPANGTADGLIFLGASVRDGQNGAMVIDDTGELVWFSVPDNPLDRQYDVRVQEYRGAPVITFAEANGPNGYRLGHYVICDNSYQRIAEFQILNGFTGGDHHELLLTPRGTAIVGVYHPVLWDMSSVGGPASGRVMDNVIQEIDIEAGRVVFEWHSLDHITLEESYSAPPESPESAYDYLHMNSIDEDDDGNVYISARHTYAIYKIDRATGAIAWRLNGKQSDFAMGEGTEFALQHDARARSGGRVSLFDNAAGQQEADATTDSRGLVLQLDEAAMTATLDAEYAHPTGILSISQANTQFLPNGNVFIGWGSAPVFSEFTEDGDLIFNGRFPQGGTSYRAYRFPWVGEPAEPPAVAVERGDGGLFVFASWNGATEVATWQVLVGPSADSLTVAGSAERAGFETAIEVTTGESWVAVEALDQDGAVLGASETIEM